MPRPLPIAVGVHGESELAALVRAAVARDAAAWTALVHRFDPTLRAVARSFRLCAADVDDVVQATWLKAFEHIDRIRDPDAISWWLTTTTRRHALRVLQGPMRELVSDDPDLGDGSHEDGPEVALLAAERREVLARAVRTLPPRQRQLITALAADSSSNYSEISRQLSMPIGSIGPIRGKSLARLARNPQLMALQQ